MRPQADRLTDSGWTASGSTHGSRPGWGRRLWTATIVAIELFVGGSWLAGVAVVQIVTTPELARRVVDLATEQARFDVTLEDVEVLPTSRLLDPSTWELAVVGVRVEPHDDRAPIVTISRLHLGMPRLGPLLADRRVQLRRARIVGLRVAARTQQPAREPRALQPVIRSVGADHVEVWGASWSAPADPPLKEGSVDLVFGELHDVVYEPASRLLSGSGRLAARRFRTGALEVEDIELPAVIIHDSSLSLDGVFGFAGARGRLRGEVEDFTRRPRTRLEVEITGARVEEAVRRATGHDSPITGTLDAFLVVRSGGEIPRGHGWMEGSARLTGGRIPLGDDIKPVIKDLIRIAPYLTLNDRDEVVLGAMNGKIRIRRGSVVLRELLYEAPRRHIQLRGEMVGGSKKLVIRFMPARDPDQRAGFGVVLSGRDRLRFRLAGRHDLLPEVYPADPDPDRAVAEADRRRRRRR